jgi:hypothetical protein
MSTPRPAVSSVRCRRTCSRDDQSGLPSWWVALDCPSPSLSPHAVRMSRTTAIAESRKQYLLVRGLSHVTGLVGAGYAVRNKR